MRNGSRLTIVLLVILAATVAHSIATISGEQHVANQAPRRTPSIDRQGPDFESQFPVADYDAPEPADDDRRRERKDKGKRYDHSGMVSRKPISEDVTEAVLDNRWQERVAALPTSQSAAVVIGEVLKSEAHLSNTRGSVYTEFVIRVEEVLKSDGSDRLVADGKISADRPGGFVRYPNGYKRLYRVFGMNMPRVGRRYVLFLSNPEQSQNYGVVTGYELSPRGVAPLDVARHFDDYKGMDEAAFLKVVRDKIAQPPPTDPDN